MEAFSELNKIGKMRNKLVKKNYGEIKDLINQLYIEPSKQDDSNEMLQTSYSRSQLSDTYAQSLKQRGPGRKKNRGRGSKGSTQMTQPQYDSQEGPENGGRPAQGAPFAGTSNRSQNARDGRPSHRSEEKGPQGDGGEGQ